MLRRALGSQGAEVSAMGLGCMGMTFGYGPVAQERAIATIDRALELGVTFFDTSDHYGPESNEVLLGKALAGRRDRAELATKFGSYSPDGPVPDGRPEHVRWAIDGSLRRLGVEHVDLYYLHRVDPRVPVEDTVGAMAELVEAGKVRYLGLSEASADTIRRAHAVHPRCHRRAGRAGVGARLGTGRRPDPRHDPAGTGRAERRRAGRRTDRGGPQAPGRDVPAGSRRG